MAWWRRDYPFQAPAVASGLLHGHLADDLAQLEELRRG